MGQLLVVLIVIVVFYMLNKNYRSSDFKYIKQDIKQKLKGKLKEHEAGLLISLMAKVSKADGHISELEEELLNHTFIDISKHFENSEEIKDELKKLYQEEIKTFDNTIDIANKYYKLTRKDYKKRLKTIEYLLNLAFIDGEFSQTEFMIIEDISKAFKISNTDLNKIINQFKSFYKQRETSETVTLEKAYKILNSSKLEDMKTIKKRYRELVKQNHPDIITGQGASKSMIDLATKKLQEINEAYELIKKERV